MRGGHVHIGVLAGLFVGRGVPVHIRSDQGPAFIDEAVKAWITGVGAETAYIEKASPWEKGYVESFNGELLNGEPFATQREAQVLIEEWRQHDSRVRPHSALGYRPPATVAVPRAKSPGSSGPGVAAMADQNSAWITQWTLVSAGQRIGLSVPARGLGAGGRMVWTTGSRMTR